MENMARFDHLCWQDHSLSSALADEEWRVELAKEAKVCDICLEDIKRHEYRLTYKDSIQRYYWECQMGCTRFDEEVA